MTSSATVGATDAEALREAAGSFKTYFLNGSNESVTAYRQAVRDVAASIATQIKEQKQPYVGKRPGELKEELASLNLLPETGTPLHDLLEKTRSLVLESNVLVYHPHCVAHLHCPPFICSLAAEMIISAFNQSMDSWDQAPAATMIEQALCDELCAAYRFGPDADAVFTGGGTMSNFMGLLLARDGYSKKRLHWDIQKKGLPAEASRFRILCSAQAHFSVVQSASILGLGQEAVVQVNHTGFEDELRSLQTALHQLRQSDLLPIAYVTTAGTTDFGTIGPIRLLADCAQQNGLWLHVDAAYGGALMLSEKHRHKLEGIEKADSVTVDFHKLFYQPISCGLFMVKDKSSFEAIRLHAEYLNPESNEDLGILDLVYKSIQTTRRFDALKPFLALQHIGRKKLGEMIDYTVELAGATGRLIEEEPVFELVGKTPINAIVFRYLPAKGERPAETDAINKEIKTRLLLSGKAVVGQTSFNGRTFLKFTLLNPLTTVDDVAVLLEEIKALGRQLEKEFRLVLENEARAAAF